MRLSRSLLWALLVAIGLTIAAPVLSWLLPLQLPDGQMLLAIGLLVVVHIVLALGCAIVLEQGLARGWMRSGMLASGFSVLGWAVVIALQSSLPYFSGQRTAVWPTAWAVLMAVIGVLLLPRTLSAAGLRLRTVAIVLCSMLAFTYCASLAFQPDYGSPTWTPAQWGPIRRFEEIAQRINLAMVFLAAGAAALTFLSLLSPRSGAAADSAAATLPLAFECPRCGRLQAGRTGGCSCESCGLQVKVRIS